MVRAYRRREPMLKVDAVSLRLGGLAKVGDLVRYEGEEYYVAGYRTTVVKLVDKGDWEKFGPYSSKLNILLEEFIDKAEKPGESGVGMVV